MAWVREKNPKRKGAAHKAAADDAFLGLMSYIVGQPNIHKSIPHLSQPPPIVPPQRWIELPGYSPSPAQSRSQSPTKPSPHHHQQTRHHHQIIVQEEPDGYAPAGLVPIPRNKHKRRAVTTPSPPRGYHQQPRHHQQVEEYEEIYRYDGYDDRPPPPRAASNAWAPRAPQYARSEVRSRPPQSQPRTRPRQRQSATISSRSSAWDSATEALVF